MAARLSSGSVSRYNARCDSESSGFELIASLYQARASALSWRAAQAAPSCRMRSVSRRARVQRRTDQGGQPVEVGGRLVVRLGGPGITGTLESRREADERLATQRVGGECDPEMVERQLRIAPRECQPAAQPCEERIIARSGREQPLGLFRFMPIELDAGH